MGCRKQRIFGWILISLINSSAVAWAQVQITSIDFKGTEDPSELTIQASGPMTFEKQENSQDKQLIIEIPDATISKSNSRKIDTSSFNSKVSLISPYQVPDKPNTVRVVVQLRDSVTPEITQEGNTLKVKVPNGTEGSSAASSSAGAPTANSTASEKLSPETTAGAFDSSADSAGQKSNLDTFEANKSTQKFTGRPVTIQVRDADVTDVLRLIGETSGFNTIIGDDVRGKITLSLVDVPWDQALDTILHTMHLGAERKDSILRVVTLNNLLNEKLEEQKAAEAAQANIPRVTRVFPVSYANLTELQKILEKFVTQTSAAKMQTGSSSTDAIVQSDIRTNSLVVRDVPENLEKVKKLIEILDTQTPQIMIEAKVVEATEGFSKSLTGSFGVGGAGSSSFVASFAGGNPLDPLIGTPGVFANGKGVVDVSNPTGGSPNGTFGLSPSVSFIPGVSQLNAVLNWGESEHQVKIVSAPKTVVLNKGKANIVEGTPVLVPGTTTIAGVGTAVPTTTVQQANVSLSVKPTVTNDGSVLLDLSVSKDIPLALPGGQQGIGNRTMNTIVLVDSGSTLVIGGIYTAETKHSAAGFPFLRKIPILGALFGSDIDSTDRSELFIFVTPRILNTKEAGLTG